MLPRYLCARELASGEIAPLLEPEHPPINTGFLARRVGAARPHVELVRTRLLAAAKRW